MSDSGKWKVDGKPATPHDVALMLSRIKHRNPEAKLRLQGLETDGGPFFRLWWWLRLRYWIWRFNNE